MEGREGISENLQEYIKDVSVVDVVNKPVSNVVNQSVSNVVSLSSNFKLFVDVMYIVCLLMKKKTCPGTSTVKPFSSRMRSAKPSSERLESPWGVLPGRGR